MTVLLILFTCALSVINGIRIMDSTYWYDEMFSIMLIRMPISELIEKTAKDVHPPLYYLILKGVCHFVGESGPVLHAVSLLPYLMVLVLSLTVVRKWFSRSTSVVLVTFASLLASAVKFNVEIRMYSWVVLFVLVSYLSLYAILYRNRAVDYAIFILASLAAAYTHYYALIAVAFFYLVLMLYALIVRREILLRVVITWGLSALGYVRWLLVLLETFGRTSSGWWMRWMPKYKDSLPAIFEGRHSWILFYIFAAVLSAAVAALIVEIATGKRMDPDRDPVKELTFLAAGAASVFGTIAVGVIVSRLFRPMYFERYIYTAAVCAWLITAIGLSRVRVRGVAFLSIALTVFVCYCGFYNYTEIYRQDEADRVMTESSVALIRECNAGMGTPLITDKDSDIRIMAYFPHNERYKLNLENGLDTDVIEKGKEYCLVADNLLTDDEITTMREAGFTCQEVRPELFKDDPDRGGFLGDLNVFVYILK